MRNDNEIWNIACMTCAFDLLCVSISYLLRRRPEPNAVQTINAYTLTEQRLRSTHHNAFLLILIYS